MSKPALGHVSPAALEYQIEILKASLSQESRDHEETRRRLQSANQKIEGFERLVKSLSAHIDKQNELIDNAAQNVSEAIQLLGFKAGAEVDSNAHP